MKKEKKDPLYKSFGYAFEGIFYGISKERNMQIHCAAAILVVAAGIWLKISVTEWCICLVLFGLIFGTGAGKHRGGSGGGPGDGGEKASGEDCQGYGGGGCAHRGIDGSHRGMCDFPSQTGGCAFVIRRSSVS